MNVANTTHTNIDQLWYTWSKIGIDPPPGGHGGYCTHAASLDLQDVHSERMRAIRHYLSYKLPMGTDRFSMQLNAAPISLVFAQNERERLLLCKTHVDDKASNAEAIYFVHLLAGLGPDFCSVDAITLWRSPFWKRQEDITQAPYLNPPTLPPYGSQQYPQVSEHFIRIEKRFQRIEEHLQLINLKKARGYLPWIFQAIFQTLAIETPETTGKIDIKRANKQKWNLTSIFTTPDSNFPLSFPSSTQPNIYIAAPADWVAYLISVVTCVLPRNLQSKLTFSTYERLDQLKRSRELIIGASLPPDYNKQLNSKSVGSLSIPEELVELEELEKSNHVLNCYRDLTPVLDHSKLEVRVALDIVERLLAAEQEEQPNFDAFLHNEGGKPDLTIDQFLSDYAEEFLWSADNKQDVIDLFLDPRIASKQLKQSHVQRKVIEFIVSDPIWYFNKVCPLIVTCAHVNIMLKLLVVGPDSANPLAQALNQIFQVENASITAIQLKNAFQTYVLDNATQEILRITLQNRYRLGSSLLSQDLPQQSVIESPYGYEAQRRDIEQSSKNILELGSQLSKLIRGPERFIQKFDLPFKLTSEHYSIIVKQTERLQEAFILLFAEAANFIKEQFRSNKNQPSVVIQPIFIDKFNVLWELMLLLAPYNQFPKIWKGLLKELLEQYQPFTRILIHQDWKIRVRLLLAASSIFNPEDRKQDLLVQPLLELLPDETGSIFAELLSWKLPETWQSILITEWSKHSAETLHKAMPQVEQKHPIIVEIFNDAPMNELLKSFYKNLVENRYTKKLTLFHIMHRRMTDA